MIMIDGIDTTRPVQLRPNGPDKRTAWAIPLADGFEHVITASHYVYDTETETAGTLYVHIGCGVMIKAAVRDGESQWDAIRRVVTTWQQEQREADHAEALTMNVHAGDVVLYTGTDNVTERRMICTDVITRRTPGRPGYVYRFAFFGHPWLTVSADPWNVRKITRDDVEADHAAALAMVAETAAPVTGQLAEGDAEYIGAKPHPRRITPGTMGPRMLAWSARVREVAAQRGMTTRQVTDALPKWIFAR